MRFSIPNPFPRIGANMMNRPRQVLFIVLSALVLTLAWIGVESQTNKAHAATCTKMSQADFDAWMSEYGGSYHDPNFAGWGDSLGRVQSHFAGGCNGTWGDLFAPGTKCGILDNVQWHKWTQPDGDENWIAFQDHGPAATPRWTAQCKAGVRNPNGGSWVFGPYTESHL